MDVFITRYETNGPILMKISKTGRRVPVSQDKFSLCNILYLRGVSTKNPFK